MNKVALITGAASGIGLEISKLMFRDNYSLILIDKDASGLTQVQSSFHHHTNNNKVRILVKDLCKPNTAEEIYNELYEQGVVIDVLVNNAGFGILGKFEETDWQQESQMINLHVHTVTHLCKLFLPGMISRKKGKILNVASLASYYCGPLMSVYYASKAYILSFSVALSNELKGTGVGITVLCPGLTRTAFQKSMCEEKALIRWNIGSAREVAKYAYRSMNNNKLIAIPGFFNQFLAALSRILPLKVSAWMIRKLQLKNRVNKFEKERKEEEIFQ